MDAATNHRLSTSATLFPVPGFPGTGAKNLLLDNDAGGLLATFDAIFREITQPTSLPVDRSKPSDRHAVSDQSSAEKPENSRSESASQKEFDQEVNSRPVEDAEPAVTVLAQDLELDLGPEEAKHVESGSAIVSLPSDHQDHLSAQPLKLESEVAPTPSQREHENVVIVLENEDDLASERDSLLLDHEREDDEKDLENAVAVTIASQQGQGIVRESRTEKKNTDEEVVEKFAVTNPQLASENLPEKREAKNEEKLATGSQFAEQRHEQDSAFDSPLGLETADRNARSERLAEIAREGRGDRQESTASNEMRDILAQMEPVEATEYYGNSLPADASNSAINAPQSGSSIADSAMVAAQTAVISAPTSASSPGTSGASSMDGGVPSTSALEGSSPSSNRFRAAAQDSKGAGEGTNTTNADRVRLVQRVARAFQKLGDGGGQVHMMLRPSHLGSVRLDLTVNGRSMEATLTAQTDAAVGALQENLGELRSRLEEFGIEIERIEIRKADLSSPSQNGSADGRNQGSSFQGSGSQNNAGTFRDGASREDRESSGRNSNRPDGHSAERQVTTSTRIAMSNRPRNSSGLDLML